MAKRDGPLAFGRPDPAQDRLQANAVLVRGPDLDRRVRVLGPRLGDGLLPVRLLAGGGQGWPKHFLLTCAPASRLPGREARGFVRSRRGSRSRPQARFGWVGSCARVQVLSRRGGADRAVAT